MTYQLSKTAKGRLRKASPVAIERYFQQHTGVARSSKWINKGNRYRVNCTDQYETDIKAHPPAVDHPHLTSYIAASGPCHLIDGWSFLGRSIDAALRSDSYTAIHLGYYAELRAAMAILACE